MRKIWLMATSTYRQRVRSGMFLLLTLGLPVLMIVAGAVPALLAARGGQAPAAIGVVDESGALAPAEPMTIEASSPAGDQILVFRPYPDRQAAQDAQQAGETGGTLLIPGGYFDGQPVSYMSGDEPGAGVEEGLERYLQRALLGERPPWVFERLQDPAVYTYASQTTGQEVGEGPALIIRLLIPIALALIFSLAVFIGANQMGVAIIREKESRAMEIVVTSLRPSELVAGKVLGMSLLSLTQFALWTTGALIAGTLAFSGAVDLSTISIPWGILFWGSLLIIPVYFLFAVTAAGVGIIAGDSQQAQQLAGLVGVLGLAPLWILGFILIEPNGPLAVGLTLFPFTAPTVALIRMLFGPVPIWQLAAAVAIATLTLAAGVWFVARIFRAAMLNYGKALRPRQIWRAFSQA